MALTRSRCWRRIMPLFLFQNGNERWRKDWREDFKRPLLLLRKRNSGMSEWLKTGGKTKRLNASDLSNPVPFLPFRMRKWKNVSFFFLLLLFPMFYFFFFFFFSFFVGITNADLIATRSRLVESSYEAGNETLAILRSGWPEFLVAGNGRPSPSIESRNKDIKVLFGGHRYTETKWEQKSVRRGSSKLKIQRVLACRHGF